MLEKIVELIDQGELAIQGGIVADRQQLAEILRDTLAILVRMPLILCERP